MILDFVWVLSFGYVGTFASFVTGAHYSMLLGLAEVFSDKTPPSFLQFVLAGLGPGVPLMWVWKRIQGPRSRNQVVFINIGATLTLAGNLFLIARTNNWLRLLALNTVLGVQVLILEFTELMISESDREREIIRKAQEASNGTEFGFEYALKRAPVGNSGPEWLRYLKPEISVFYFVVVFIFLVLGFCFGKSIYMEKAELLFGPDASIRHCYYLVACSALLRSVCSVFSYFVFV